MRSNIDVHKPRISIYLHYEASEVQLYTLAVCSGVPLNESINKDILRTF